MEFKVGDVVEWCGCRGVVKDETDHRNSGGNYCIIVVSFDENKTSYDSFYNDGKKYSWHKEPSLKLIKRVKRFYKILYIDNNNDYTITHGLYASESEFKDKYSHYGKFVRFIEETMIEVEE